MDVFNTYPRAALVRVTEDFATVFAHHHLAPLNAWSESEWALAPQTAFVLGIGPLFYSQFASNGHGSPLPTTVHAALARQYQMNRARVTRILSEWEQVLGALRLELAERFGLIPLERHDVRWVVEFPMFMWNDEQGRWEAEHHPFTAPTGDLDDPASLLSRSYDLVLDGAEIGGGPVRHHRPEVQARTFELIGIGPEEARARFGFLLPSLLDI